ncbi:hypothetical protein ED733_000764 [Metarhizium rileyi]|uniref:Protein-arginine deiminase C-terminal domain-containing protein n=1 Tax=Metarhizium rileyi (strain RCEF 4871) TaxID=1649241 RepID=A0A5C6G3P1_METRR|nr:hypothetical protein ED733_000764 [Metarhizium rileyi]
MPRIATTAAILTLGLASVCQALCPVILADTNRDGKVDLEGGTDLPGKDTWTEKVGALFLANIGDTNRRCSDKIKLSMGEEAETSQNTPDEELDKCHDASDNVLRNAKYLASMKTVPMSNLSSSSTASVVVLGESAAKNVRIFHKSGSNWSYVASNYTFGVEELRHGLELGIDGRDVRRPDGWDGRATVQLTIRDGANTCNDSVALRVAPVLTHHHLQLASEILTSEAAADGFGARFAKDLQSHVEKAGIRKPVTLVRGDSWTQDYFEPGYSSIPGPDGPVMLRVLIRAAVDSIPGRVVFADLRSDSVGAVQEYGRGSKDDEDMDHTGNLETIPPHTHNGKSYPAGRAVMGSRAGQKPNMFRFLLAQETQAPVEIDTTWLYVGHTDEFMQFLPADNERGWVMMVDDPRAGLELLRGAQRAGHGNVRALSRPAFPTDGLDTRSKNISLPAVTIDGVLSRANFSRVQDYAARNIDKNIDTIKRETGLTDAEIVRVPALYYNEPMPGPRQYQPVRHLPEVGPDEDASLRNLSQAFQVYSLYPGVINGLVLTRTHYLAPDPWGPVVDGKDLLKEAVAAAYAKANMVVEYMDDWFSHHLGVGEVHCGSNSIRDPTIPWW